MHGKNQYLCGVLSLKYGMHRVEGAEFVVNETRCQTSSNGRVWFSAMLVYIAASGLAAF